MTITARGCPKGKVKVVSRKGKNLSKCTSRGKARKRLRQVEFFKHRRR